MPFSILDKEFADSGAAKLWMIRNQFGRRNLSSFQRASLALEMKPMLAEIAKENQIRKPVDSVMSTIDTTGHSTRDTGS